MGPKFEGEQMPSIEESFDIAQKTAQRFNLLEELKKLMEKEEKYWSIEESSQIRKLQIMEQGLLSEIVNNFLKRNKQNLSVEDSEVLVSLKMSSVKHENGGRPTGAETSFHLYSGEYSINEQGMVLFAGPPAGRGPDQTFYIGDYETLKDELKESGFVEKKDVFFSLPDEVLNNNVYGADISDFIARQRSNRAE